MHGALARGSHRSSFTYTTTTETRNKTGYEEEVKNKVYKI